MNHEELYNVFEGYKNNCIYRFAVCLVLVIIVIILLVFFIKRKDKEIRFINKGINIIIIIIFIALFVSSLISGIRIAKIAYRLNLDYEEMAIERTCGEVTNIYFKNKIRFIVVDSKEYILNQVLIGNKAYKGEEYCIDYYKNSKFINNIKSIETNINSE